MKHLLSSVSQDLVQAADLLAAPSRNRLFIDVRLGEPDEEYESFLDCHILGAVHAQIREVFAAEPSADSGNLPLPDIDRLRQTLLGWGVDGETEVVTYGPSAALAARGWWVLKWAGLKDVKVLDGGMKAWINNGGPVARGDSHPRLQASGVPLVLQPGQLPSIDVQEVETLPEDALLIDARDEGSFQAGAIPRAINLPAADQWTPGATLRTIREISQIYADAGVSPQRDVVVYCGGGVLSALLVLTLSSLGTRPRLFVGSWSEWNKSPARMARSDTKRIAV
ncbi:MAG: sulfurtransferase [Burkholderiales bacterium]|nr:sulfurtransferase [Burkholderiales bacterium]